MFIGKYNARNMFNQDTIHNNTNHTYTKKHNAAQLKSTFKQTNSHV